jgi:hypothetical protein
MPSMISSQFLFLPILSYSKEIIISAHSLIIGSSADYCKRLAGLLK